MTNSQEIQNLIDQITGRQFRRYNVKLAKLLSINSSVFLIDLCDCFSHHLIRGEIEGENDWFYYTEDKCFERTALSRKEQETSIKLLIENDLIEKKVIGSPPKRHYRVKFKNVKEFFEKSEEKSISPFGQIEKPKRRNPLLTNDTKEEILSYPTFPEEGRTGEEFLTKEEKLSPKEDLERKLELLESLEIPDRIRDAKKDTLSQRDKMAIIRFPLERIKESIEQYYLQVDEVECPYRMISEDLQGRWNRDASKTQSKARCCDSRNKTTQEPDHFNKSFLCAANEILTSLSLERDMIIVDDEIHFKHGGSTIMNLPRCGIYPLTKLKDFVKIFNDRYLGYRKQSKTQIVFNSASQLFEKGIIG